MNKQEKMHELKMKFVRKACNYRVLKKIHERIRSTKQTQGKWATPEIRELIKRARKEIGYSPKTINIDIANGLYVASRSG